jgi:hypothetical protein
MNAAVSTCLDSNAWRGFYKAALFELDATKRPERIAQAERSLVVRARELFEAAGDNIEEEQAVDDAMYALHALRSALMHNTATTATTGYSDHSQAA